MRIGKNLLLVLAVATVLLTACNNEDLVEKSYSSNIITATMAEASSDSRTSIEGLQVIWNENDAISVFAGEYQNFKGVLTNGSGTKKADFQLDGYTSGTKHVALYPYLAGASYDGNAISLNVPSAYEYEKNNIGGSTMAALIGDDSEIAFKNAGALMGLTVKNIPAGYNQAILRSTVEEQPLTGDCIITFDNEGLPTIQSSTAGEAAVGNEITITFEAEAGATKTFYFPIPVAKYTSLEFSIKGGLTPIVLKTKGLDAKRNKRYQTAVTLGENGAVPVAVRGAEEISKALAEGATSLVISVNNSKDAEITLPACEQNLVLTFEPTNETITLKGAEGTSTNITIAASLGAKFNIDLPTTTVTLSANGESTNYETITARTAENTLIVEEGVTVKDLKVAGGNVKVYGNVEKLSRTDENEDEVTAIDKQGEGSLGTLVGDKTMFFVEIDNTYEIGTLAALKYFAKDVDNGNTYEGKKVFLTYDIDMCEYDDSTQERVSFDPIGKRSYSWDGNKKASFNGIFDGKNHTIKNLYQNGWDLDYHSGHAGVIGLFALVDGATIQNLTVEGFELRVEGGNVAAIAGMAVGNSTFKNITVKNSVVCSYNNGVAPIAGWVEGGNFTFEDITIEDNVTVAAFWGTYDASLGGIIAEAYTNSTYTFKNVTVNCRLDAYNDVTSNYKWYAYRNSGMVVGNVETTQKIGDTTYPNPAACNIKCENVVINYGDWVNYHYCVTQNNNENNYRVEPGYSYNGLPKDHDHDKCIVPEGNSEKVCRTLLTFDQLFGGGKGVYGLNEYEGVTVKYPNTVSGTTPSN